MSGRTDALVLGCGWLGQLLVPALARDANVLAVTRGTGRHAALAGARGQRVRCAALDLGSPGAGEALVTLAGAFDGDAWLLVPPSGLPPGDAAAAALTGLVTALGRLGLRRAVMASSTGVYGDFAGGAVTERTPPRPASAREHRLAALEAAWLAGGERFRVLRLGGLYGPGRVIGAATLRAGAAVPGDPDGWLNLVHGGDAAAALIASARAGAALRIGLATDGTPVRRDRYYTYLAERLGVSAPRFAPDEERRGGSRRCDPAATWAALGLAPRYPDYRAGLGALLAATRG